MAAHLDLLDESIRDAAKELVRQCGAAGYLPRVTSTLRSNAEQTRLYARYLANQAGYPVAPPGLSAHEYGLAFDMLVEPMDALAYIGSVWRSWGGGWSPSDAIHFEYPNAQAVVKKIAGRASIPRDDPFIVSVMDFAASFIPGVGELQLAEYVAQWLDPIPDSNMSWEGKVSRFLRSPIGTIYRAWAS